MIGLIWNSSWGVVDLDQGNIEMAKKGFLSDIRTLVTNILLSPLC
jgi:hypothetical protein